MVFPFKRDKKTRSEKLEELQDRFQDLKIDLSVRLKTTEAKIASYFKQAKMPPAPLLATWKVMTSMVAAVDGALHMLEGVQAVSEFRETIGELINSKEFAEATKIASEELKVGMRELKNSLKSILGLQRALVVGSQNIGIRVDATMQELDSLVSNMAPEAVEAVGAEFLKKLMVDNPGDFQSIPDEVKKKFLKPLNVEGEK